jgi:hypothetical protein
MFQRQMIGSCLVGAALAGAWVSRTEAAGDPTPLVAQESARQFATLCISKFFDADADGVNDGEPPLDDVRFQVTISTYNGGAPFVISTRSCKNFSNCTGSPGQVCLDQLPVPFTYTVCEQLPTTPQGDCSWIQTLPGRNTPGTQFLGEGWCYAGEVSAAGVVNLEFGNACLCPPAGGFTPGFWSNQNGMAVLAANDPGWRDLLNSSCLRSADGNLFQVPAGPFSSAFGHFQTWLLQANATNMAYMLSIHTAAAKLNVAYKGLAPGTVLMLPPNLADCFGASTVSVQDLIAMAEALLCADGFTPPGDPNRDGQECVKDILDGLNNDAIPTFSSSPCSVFYLCRAESSPRPAVAASSQPSRRVGRRASWADGEWPSGRRG